MSSSGLKIWFQQQLLESSVKQNCTILMSQHWFVWWDLKFDVGCESLIVQQIDTLPKTKLDLENGIPQRCFPEQEVAHILLLDKLKKSVLTGRWAAAVTSICRTKDLGLTALHWIFVMLGHLQLLFQTAGKHISYLDMFRGLCRVSFSSSDVGTDLISVLFWK